MSGNIKFRWFLLTVVALLVVVSSSVISSAGELENAQEAVRQNPNDAKAHYNLGNAYVRSGQHKDAIASFKETIRINPNLAEVHYNLGLSFGQTNNGFGAITHTIIAVKLFERQNNSQLAAFAKSNLRNWFKVFQKYRPEDFANIQIPRPSQPSSPDDAQLIIDAAKTGYLTEELHKKYWDDLKKKGGDKHLFKTITDWYPRINRLQMQHNREFVKSLKLTLKNKKITYSAGYEASYQKMKQEMFNLPLKKGSKEYSDMYGGMIESFKQSKDGTDQMFQFAITGETFTYPFDKNVKFKIDLQYVLAIEASMEEGWKNLLKLFNPTWSK